MSCVLIIGAGGVGRVVTHKCAQNPEVFSDIWLASRTVSRCEQIAAEVDGKTGQCVRTAAVDGAIGQRCTQRREVLGRQVSGPDSQLAERLHVRQ